MIPPETHVEIRRYFYAEHWKIGTIARELSIHPDAVRKAIESDRFHRGQELRPSIIDPYLEFVRQILDQHPRLRATRIYQRHCVEKRLEQMAVGTPSRMPIEPCGMDRRRRIRRPVGRLRSDTPVGDSEEDCANRRLLPSLLT